MTKIAEAVVAGRRLLCLIDSSTKPGDCVDAHNKAAWSTRQGLGGAALEGWNLAYGYAATMIHLKCREHVGNKFRRDDLFQPDAEAQYLECAEKALQGARSPLGKKPITFLDGRSFDFKSFLMTLGGGDKVSRDVRRTGEKLLCVGDAACTRMLRTAVAESHKDLKPHQKKWWQLVYDYAVQTTRINCLLRALDATRSTNLAKRAVRTEYLTCVNGVVAGTQRSSFVKLLDGTLYAWASLLKLPRALQPMPQRLAVVKVRVGRGGRHGIARTPVRAPEEGEGGGGIRISPGSGPSRTPSGGRKVLRCDEKSCE